MLSVAKLPRSTKLERKQHLMTFCYEGEGIFKKLINKKILVYCFKTLVKQTEKNRGQEADAHSISPAKTKFSKYSTSPQAQTECLGLRRGPRRKVSTFSASGATSLTTEQNEFFWVVSEAKGLLLRLCDSPQILYQCVKGPGLGEGKVSGGYNRNGNAPHQVWHSPLQPTPAPK